MRHDVIHTRADSPASDALNPLAKSHARAWVWPAVMTALVGVTSLAVAIYAAVWLVPVYLGAMAWILDVPIGSRLMAWVAPARRKPTAAPPRGMDEADPAARERIDVAAHSRLTPAHDESVWPTEPEGVAVHTSTDVVTATLEVSSSVEPPVVKTRRGRPRTRKAKSASTPATIPSMSTEGPADPAGAAATWIRVGPGKFVRSDAGGSPAPEASEPPAEPAVPMPEPQPPAGEAVTEVSHAPEPFEAAPAAESVVAPSETFGTADALAGWTWPEPDAPTVEPAPTVAMGPPADAQANAMPEPDAGPEPKPGPESEPEMAAEVPPLVSESTETPSPAWEPECQPENAENTSTIEPEPTVALEAEGAAEVNGLAPGEDDLSDSAVAPDDECVGSSVEPSGDNGIAPDAFDDLATTAADDVPPESEPVMVSDLAPEMDAPAEPVATSDEPLVELSDRPTESLSSEDWPATDVAACVSRGTAEATCEDSPQARVTARSVVSPTLASAMRGNPARRIARRRENASRPWSVRQVARSRVAIGSRRRTTRGRVGGRSRRANRAFPPRSPPHSRVTGRFRMVVFDQPGPGRRSVS